MGFPLIGKEELVFGEELGSGSFGAVYRAEWTRPDGEGTVEVSQQSSAANSSKSKASPSLLAMKYCEDGILRRR